jgi:hypothetical protein
MLAQTMAALVISEVSVSVLEEDSAQSCDRKGLMF